MKSDLDGVYPLFPLEVVLYPNMPLPLHIFEPRYRKMIADCLSDGREFGVILQRHGRMYSVGTLAKIENVLERFPDGRMNILTLGKKRFILQELVEGKDYHQARVQILEDLPEDPRKLEPFRVRGESLMNEYAQLTGIHSEADNFQNLTCTTFSYLLSEINGFSLSKQQEILELPTVSARYEKALEALEHVVERQRIIKEMKEILGPQADVEQILN